MKRSVTIEGWTLVLRIRVQRKKRKVNGRTRGRYEGKTAHAIVKSPSGERREWYLGSGEKLVRQVLTFVNEGEEKTRGAPKTRAPKRGGRTGGKKAIEMCPSCGINAAIGGRVCNSCYSRGEDRLSNGVTRFRVAMAKQRKNR